MVHNRSIGIAWRRSSKVKLRVPVYSTTPAVKASPKRPRSARKPWKSEPATRAAALTSNATTRPSSAEPVFVVEAVSDRESFKLVKAAVVDLPIAESLMEVRGARIVTLEVNR